jgi:hypothetical protein
VSIFTNILVLELDFALSFHSLSLKYVPCLFIVSVSHFAANKRRRFYHPAQGGF